MKRIRVRPFTGSRSVAGQALTELAVCAAVLVPLFLLIPIVAKFGHANQMGQQAARNAAWAASVSPGYDSRIGGLLQNAALDRSFADPDAPIRSNPTAQTTGEFDDQMLNTFSGRKLLERDNLRVGNLGDRSSPGFMDEALTLLPRVGRFPPNANGYVRSEVRLEYRNLQNRDGGRPRYLDPFDQLDVVQTRHQSLLVDAWNASGPRSGRRDVISTVSPLVPTEKLPDFDEMCGSFDVLGEIMPIVGAVCDLKFGVIEPDIVPPDKLTEYPVRRR